MTQYPYPQDPNNPPPYNAYAAPGYGTLPYATQTPTKPTSITVLAIFSIILGGLGVLCTGWGVLGGIIGLVAGSSRVMANQPQLNSGLQWFGIASSVIEFALAAVLLAAGVGALSLKPWSRRALVPSWSVAMIAWAFVRLIVQIAWVAPATSALMKQAMQQASRGGPAPPPAFQEFLGSLVIVMSVVWFLIELVLPICFLTFWRRPHVVAAFETGGAPQYGSPNA